MSKYIDADKLKAEIKRRIEWLSTATTDFAEGRRVEMRSLYDFIDSLQQELPDPKVLPPVVPLSKFPTLRQSIEEQLYNQVVRKLPGCPPHAGIRVDIILRPSTVRNLKKDYEQNGVPATAVGKVFTNTDPMNLYVERDQWAALLGQFDNGQRVRIILVKEDAE